MLYYKITKKNSITYLFECNVL